MDNRPPLSTGTTILELKHQGPIHASGTGRIINTWIRR